MGFITCYRGIIDLSCFILGNLVDADKNVALVDLRPKLALSKSEYE